MRWQHIKTIYLKEIMDTVRDKRTLYVMILVPLILMPALMLLGPVLGERETKKTQETVYNVVVQGEENSKELVTFLKQSPKLKVVNSSTPEEALKNGDVNLIVTIPKGFTEEIQKEKVAKVDLKYQGKNSVSDAAKMQVSEIINTYGKQVVATRLSQRGLSSEVLEPLQINSSNIASQEEMGGAFLAMILPMIIVLWSVVGGMYTAIDLGAGEKERGTLEALLVTPPSRKAVVMGKYLAILTVAMITIVLALTSMVLSLKFLMPMFIKGAESQKITLPMTTTAIILGIAFLVTGFLSALQLAISAFARSFKEAQNYITPLYLLAVLPASVLQFMPSFQPPEPMFYLPIINAVLEFKELFMGNIVGKHLGMVVSSNIVFIYLALRFVFKTFDKEKVLFRT